MLRGIRGLQDVVVTPIWSLRYACAYMAVGGVDGWPHMIGISPSLHDLINAQVSHRKILSRPDRSATTIARRSDAAARITNMPGHTAGCHSLSRGLRHSVDNRIFDQRRQSQGDPQSVHRQDQLTA